MASNMQKNEKVKRSAANKSKPDDDIAQYYPDGDYESMEDDDISYQALLKSTVFTLITVAAVAVLVATLWLPVMRTYGNSMTPTLNNGEIIFSVKTN